MLAAHRCGLARVVLPRQNRKQVDEDLGDELRRAVAVDYVTRIDEVAGAGAAAHAGRGQRGGGHTGRPRVLSRRGRAAADAARRDPRRAVASTGFIAMPAAPGSSSRRRTASPRGTRPQTYSGSPSHLQPGSSFPQVLQQRPRGKRPHVCSRSSHPDAFSPAPTAARVASAPTTRHPQDASADLQRRARREPQRQHRDRHPHQLPAHQQEGRHRTTRSVHTPPGTRVQVDDAGLNQTPVRSCRAAHPHTSSKARPQKVPRTNDIPTRMRNRRDGGTSFLLIRVSLVRSQRGPPI